MTSVALIDYGAGNIRSAERALLHVGATVKVTAAPGLIARADRIVLPGQGAFAQCMAGLEAKADVIEALEDAVRRRGVPFLGICVGMQLMAEYGLEHTRTQGLGWIPGICRKLETAERLPHMGWNEVIPLSHPVLEALAPARRMYFAHSFIFEPAEPARVAARTEHGEIFASAVASANMLGVQFHPEKSQAAGLALLARFLDWKP